MANQNPSDPRDPRAGIRRSARPSENGAPASRPAAAPRQNFPARPGTPRPAAPRQGAPHPGAPRPGTPPAERPIPRQGAPRPAAPRLTPEELQARRQMQLRRQAEARQAEAERQRVQAAAREQRRRQLYRILSGALVLLLLAGVGLLVWYIVRQNRNKLPGKVTYHVGDSTYTMPYSAVTAYSSLYLNFTDVAAYLGLSSVGDQSRMRYLLADGSADSTGSGAESYVAFTPSRTEAEIDGTAVTLPAPPLLLNGQLWVPVDFVNAHMTGVTATVSSGSVVTVTRDTVKDEKGNPTGNVPVALTTVRRIPWPEIPDGTTGTEAQPPVTQPPVTQPPVTADPADAVINAVTFRTDLSAYETYMNPQGAARDAYLTLVNKTETVDASVKPSATVKLNTAYTYNGRTVEMETQAAGAMEAMFLEMFAAGYTDMHVTSGYRSYENQKSLYNTYVGQEMTENSKLTRAEAEAIVDTYSAREGTSEHQTGLCADLHNLSSADRSFANQPAYTWLQENAWKFGFVLRFPEDKTGITGYSFEPWHWRYVGRYHAYKMWSAGVCLEEYLAGLAAGS